MTRAVSIVSIALRPAPGTTWGSHLPRQESRRRPAAYGRFPAIFFSLIALDDIAKLSLADAFTDRLDQCAALRPGGRPGGRPNAESGALTPGQKPSSNVA